MGLISPGGENLLDFLGAPWLVTPLLHAHPGASKGCPSKEEIETITQAKVRIITQEEPLRKLTGHQRSIHSDAGF